MSKEEISLILNKEIHVLAQNDINLTDASKMKEVGLNSIDFVKLLVFSEDKFDITFSDDDLVISDEITFGDLINKIDKYVVEKN